jgi:hypothetical protein
MREVGGEEGEGGKVEEMVLSMYAHMNKCINS